MNELVSSLRKAKAYSHATAEIKVVETHASWVFLTGEFAYKIKKPIKFPFLDFSTLALRKHYCEEELRLNRRLAPEVYLEVVPIGGSRADPRVGAEPAIEYAVKMIQFPLTATLEIRIEGAEVTAAEFRELAELIADFHSGLAATEGTSAATLARTNANELFELFELLIQPERAQLQRVIDWIEYQSRRLADAMQQRAQDGAIREGHGDLHLANLVYFGNRIVPFDCLEFDRALRCIDTIDEVAFLTMDCLAHQRQDLAFEFLNRYLEVTGDYAGVRFLRFYWVHRALVRCKARRLQSQQHAERAIEKLALRYLDLAQRLTEPAPPILAITHGFSGCGKTTVTTGLIGALPAIRVRSDLERKRMAGLRPGQSSDSALNQGIYTATMTAATYAELERAVAAALEARLSIIVDATFLVRDKRDRFANLALKHDAKFVILDLRADESVLRQRVEHRSLEHGHASEADLEVLERQLSSAECLGEDEQKYCIAVDANRPVDAATLAQAIVAETT